MSDVKLTLRRGDFDWWLIERAEHDGRSWLEPTEYGFAVQRSARISDADVEGTSNEMLKIAAAIRARGSYHAKRCAVSVSGDAVSFCSPRNSTRDGVTSLACADELATEIETKLSAEEPSHD